MKTYTTVPGVNHLCQPGREELSIYDEDGKLLGLVCRNFDDLLPDGPMGTYRAMPADQLATQEDKDRMFEEIEAGTYEPFYCVTDAPSLVDAIEALEKYFDKK